jgi:hypothetical protein
VGLKGTGVFFSNTPKRRWLRPLGFAAKSCLNFAINVPSRVISKSQASAVFARRERSCRMTYAAAIHE